MIAIEMPRPRSLLPSSAVKEATTTRVATWAAGLAVVVGVVGLREMPARAGAERGPPGADDIVSDRSGLLAPRDRAALVRRLHVAQQHLGAPIHVLVVKQLHHETAADRAANAFGAWRATSTQTNQGGNDDDSGNASDAILLVLSVHDRAAAIETGKGNAGIVPEVDARKIVARLTSAASSESVATRLAHAVNELVESAEATSARRRPLPRPSEAPSDLVTDAAAGADLDAGPDRDDGTQNAQATSVSSTAADAAADGATSKSTATDGPNTAGPKSKLPWAAGLAILIILALALRRRRQVTHDHDGPRGGRDADERRGGRRRF